VFSGVTVLPRPHSWIKEGGRGREKKEKGNSEKEEREGEEGGKEIGEGKERAGREREKEGDERRGGRERGRVWSPSFSF